MPTKAQLQEQLKRERELADSKYRKLEAEFEAVEKMKDELETVIIETNSYEEEVKQLRKANDRNLIELKAKLEGFELAFRILHEKEKF